MPPLSLQARTERFILEVKIGLAADWIETGLLGSPDAWTPTFRPKLDLFGECHSLQGRDPRSQRGSVPRGSPCVQSVSMTGWFVVTGSLGPGTSSPSLHAGRGRQRSGTQFSSDRILEVCVRNFFPFAVGAVSSESQFQLQTTFGLLQVLSPGSFESQMLRIS